MRRYFDEYRGLRETIGHVEPLSARGVVGRDAPPGGRRPALDGASARGPRARRARWTARSALHHSTPAGVRRARLARRAPARRACAARSRSRAGPAARDRRADGGRRGARRRSSTRSPGCRGDGPAPLDDAGARAWRARERLHVAVVDPAVRARQRRPQLDLPDRPLARAHGPHLLALGARPAGQPRRPSGAAVLRRRIVVRVRAAPGAGVQGLRRVARRRRGGGHRLGDGLPGAAARRLPRAGLPRARPRARVLRHLGERLWAEQTYHEDLYPISSSRWLRG